MNSTDKHIHRILEDERSLLPTTLPFTIVNMRLKKGIKLRKTAIVHVCAISWLREGFRRNRGHASFV